MKGNIYTNNKKWNFATFAGLAIFVIAFSFVLPVQAARTTNRDNNRGSRTVHSAPVSPKNASTTAATSTSSSDTSDATSTATTTRRSFIFPSLFIFGNYGSSTRDISASSSATSTATTTATSTSVVPAAGSVYAVIKSKDNTPQNPTTPSVGLRNAKSAAGDAAGASLGSPYAEARLGVPMTFTLGLTALALGLLGVLLVSGKSGAALVGKATALPRSIMGSSSRFTRKVSLGH